MKKNISEASGIRTGYYACSVEWYSADDATGDRKSNQYQEKSCTDYQAHESQSVLEKLYGNSLKKFVTSLYQGKKISSEEIHELSDFLKEIEDREE